MRYNQYTNNHWETKTAVSVTVPVSATMSVSVDPCDTTFVFHAEQLMFMGENDNCFFGPPHPRQLALVEQS